MLDKLHILTELYNHRLKAELNTQRGALMFQNTEVG